MILAFRTDQAEAELYLLDASAKVLVHHHWLADRQLADSLVPATAEFLKKNHKDWQDLTGLIVFTGSGSFTGLRISTTVANALAFSLNLPIVKAAGEHWLDEGAKQLTQIKPGNYVTPDYSAEPNITRPKTQ